MTTCTTTLLLVAFKRLTHLLCPQIAWITRQEFAGTFTDLSPVSDKKSKRVTTHFTVPQRLGHGGEQCGSEMKD